ncbi:MAG: Metal cation efflux system protein CzcD [Chlamydiia bacterium]|nr:Metal cation efflux system protein CzcD [Chlamydiia bacterium]MCH9615305.1 Metal cation efflux system protein CzcD [Chlamydiia bacterium]MCH9628373.1 Metal cation efflux system protein CzcD [Chlamydiia bacterium]
MGCNFDLKTFSEESERSSKLKVAIFIAIGFMLVELIGGILAHSLALISDALHMLTDVGAFIISLTVLKISMRPSTAKLTFGYGRAEVLGALGNALTLWGLVAVLVYEAITRMIHPEHVSGGVVFIIAGIGLIANFSMMRVLHTHEHDHDLNVKAAYLHVIGDLLASIGVLLSGLIIYFTGWNILDPIITLIISALILITSWKVIKTSVLIFLEAAPGSVNPSEITKALEDLDGVKEVCDLHVWNISPKEISLTAQICGSVEKITIRELLKKKFSITHSTLEISP